MPCTEMLGKHGLVWVMGESRCWGVCVGNEAEVDRIGLRCPEMQRIPFREELE